MKRLNDMAQKAANSDKTLLITGETGVEGNVGPVGPKCGLRDLYLGQLRGHSP